MTTLRAPHAIPILTTGKNGKVYLDEEALKGIFQDERLQDKLISIVSIAGAFRKGKSFMMNFFLKYLRRKGYECPEWKGGQEESLDEGFCWRGGKEACTHGILIWSEVFVVKNGDEEIAVLLMDTQGLFDNSTDHKTNTLIFALSTLISSVQIFNLTQQIQENDLGFLQFFVEYAKASYKFSHGVKPFQTLIFLIRDCQFGEDDGLGFDAGEKYVDDILKEKGTNKEIREVREHLKSSFEDIRCCLLPHPGKKVSSTKAFRGCLEDIDEDFIDQIDPLLDNIFKPDKLVTKKINGRDISGIPFLAYILLCGKELTSGKLPTPKALMETTAQVQNLEAERFCRDKYMEDMDKAMGGSFIDEKVLNEKHKEIQASVFKIFEERTKLGSEEIRQEHRNSLQMKVLVDFERAKTKNKAKRIEAEKTAMEHIDKLSVEYKENMEKKMEKRNNVNDYLEEMEFSRLHDEQSKEMTIQYWENDDIKENVKKHFEKSFQDRLDAICKELKDGNDHKRKIAVEQNITEKFLLIATLDGCSDYRDAMAECIGNYMEESDLESKHEYAVRKTMNEFERTIASSSYQISPEQVLKYKRQCKNRLSNEFDGIKAANENKMDLLKKQLESQIHNFCVDYDNYFEKELQKDLYCEPSRLKELHDKKMEEFLEDAERISRGKMHLQIYADHKWNMKKKMKSKYKELTEANDKNKSSCILS